MIEKRVRNPKPQTLKPKTLNPNPKPIIDGGCGCRKPVLNLQPPQTEMSGDVPYMEVSQDSGYLLGAQHNEDLNILGSILGS